MNTFTSKTVFEFHSLEFGTLELPRPVLPLQWITSKEPEITFQEDFKLEVLYSALADEGPVTVKAHYTCPIVQFLKEAGIFSAHDNNPEDCQWQLTEHEFIPSQECSEKSFLVKVITFGDDNTYNSVDLVVVKAASASKARFTAASLFAEGEISASGEHVFTDTTGYTYVADSAKEVAEQDAEILKNYL